MSVYSAVEVIVVTGLIMASLRVMWLRVLKPAFEKSKTACGSACQQCAVRK